MNAARLSGSDISTSRPPPCPSPQSCMALASVGASPGVTQQQEALASAAGEDFIKCAGKEAVPGLTQFRETLRKLLAADGSKGHIPALIQIVLDSGYLE